MSSTDGAWCREVEDGPGIYCGWLGRIMDHFGRTTRTSRSRLQVGYLALVAAVILIGLGAARANQLSCYRNQNGRAVTLATFRYLHPKLAPPRRLLAEQMSCRGPFPSAR